MCAFFVLKIKKTMCSIFFNLQFEIKHFFRGQNLDDGQQQKKK